MSAEEQLKVRIVAREDAGAGLTLVHLEVPEELRASYARHGQVLVVRGETEDAYFALAAPRTADRWALLVRDAGTVAHTVVTAPLGTELVVAVPSFAGFPAPDGGHGRLWLVAVGSALGAIRGLYLALEEASRAPLVTLFLGVREVEQIPLRSELEALVRAGASVEVCVSHAEAVESAPFTVRKGLVQDAVVAAYARGERADALFVAGPPGMMEDFRARAEDLELIVHANA